MKLVIEINLDNAAFEEDWVSEVGSILDGMCERLPDPMDDSDPPLTLMDSNGNRVGSARIVED